MKKFLFLAIAALGLAACVTDAPTARRVLSDQGYTDIRITGYRVFGCSGDDDVRTGFTAKSAAGKPVTGVVCGGFLFKSNTIRID